MPDSIETGTEDTGDEDIETNFDCEKFTKCQSCPAYDRFDGDIEKYYNDIERDIQNVSSQLKNIEFLYYSINGIVGLLVSYYIVFHIIMKYKHIIFKSFI